MINNAIHPGEPDGVDASMLLLRDIALHPEKFPELDSVVLATIPFYNIGGALNRNSTTRTNQDGPLEYGFRGNARNIRTFEHALGRNPGAIFGGRTANTKDVTNVPYQWV